MTTQPRGEMPASQRRTFSLLAQKMAYFHAHFRHTWDTLYSATDTSSRAKATLSPMMFLRTARQFLRQLAMHHAIEEQHIFPVLAAHGMHAFADHGGHNIVNEKHIDCSGTNNSFAIPDGSSGNGTNDEIGGRMRAQHAIIHAGMDYFSTYLTQIESGERELRMSDARGVMDWTPSSSEGGEDSIEDDGLAGNPTEGGKDGGTSGGQGVPWGKVLMQHLDEEVENLAPERFWEAGWTAREMEDFVM